MALWKTMIHPKCFSAEEWVAYIKAAQNSEAMKRFEEIEYIHTTRRHRYKQI